MDKKVLTGIIAGIVDELKTENSLEESEARALVGIWLRRNKTTVKTAALAPFVTNDLS
jgi:hypothetical protein